MSRCRRRGCGRDRPLPVPARDVTDQAQLRGKLHQNIFACDVTGVALAVSGEHTEMAWMPYQQAYDRLRYESNKTGLWELSERLRRKDLQLA